jgi:hypothetical protein
VEGYLLVGFEAGNSLIHLFNVLDTCLGNLFFEDVTGLISRWNKLVFSLQHLAHVKDELFLNSI